MPQKLGIRGACVKARRAGFLRDEKKVLEFLKRHSHLSP
jgi:hypothetical protein